MKHLFFFLFFTIAVSNIYGQGDDCKVMLDSLKGTYTGECKSGKANGAGKAVGFNNYEGQFVNGYPEGKGMYIWKDGHYYIGEFKKGKLNGAGEMFYESVTGKDSIIRGYWEKDKYIGEYKNPYVIVNTTTEVGALKVRKMSDNEATVSITVESLNTSSSAVRNGFQTTTVMTSHQITRGTYLSKSTSQMTNREVTIFRGVVFPFRGMFYFGNSIVEIEIFAKGAWDIVVPINK